MQLCLEEDCNFNIFEKGYPKKIFKKHYVKPRIYYGPKNSIIGVNLGRLEFWSYIYSKDEEIEKFSNNTFSKLKRTNTLENLN